MGRLTSLAELRAEGARMHNCVASCDDEVRAGRTAVFSARIHGRACTLAFVRHVSGWSVSELKGFANRKATAAERNAIEPWLQIMGVEAW